MEGKENIPPGFKDAFDFKLVDALFGRRAFKRVYSTIILFKVNFSILTSPKTFKVQKRFL
jgi:hypothetical protein